MTTTRRNTPTSSNRAQRHTVEETAVVSRKRTGSRNTTITT